MRTPTLVVAIILAMAMAGDSANIERLLRQLRLLAGEETMDDASMTHTKGKSVDTGETQLLDLVKKLSLESKEPEPIDGDVNGEGDTDVDPNYEMAETQDPTLKDFSGQKVPDVEENYDMAGLGDQNPTSEEGEAEGGEVTEQNYDQSETGEEYSTSTDGSEQAPDFGQNYDMTGFQNQDPTSEGVEEEGSTDVEQNYDVAKIGEKDSTLKEDEQAPDVGQNYGMTGREDQDPTSKEVGGEKGPDVEQKYDMTGREDPDQTLRGCPGGYVYHQPSRLCYKAFNDATTYNGAVSGCSSDGGTLAMPRDNATNNFLIDLKNAVDNNAYFRFGLTDVHREGVWVWDDNVPLGDFTAWGPGQPDNYRGVEEEDCAEYLTESSSNTWNDGNCAHADRKFICQVFPPADSNNAFTCHRCQPGHACTLREDICPAGTASNDNRTMCVPCAAGEFSSAPGTETCQKCPAGKYSTGGGSTSCLDCPAGKYSEAVGSTGCKVCPAGQYSNTTSSTGCEACPAGQYSSTAGSNGCTDCPAGQYSSTAGSSGCTNCPAGKYSSTGSSRCLDCPAGKYSNVAKSTRCSDCPAGQYSSRAGSSGCTSCPAGQYSSRAGSTSCLSCSSVKPTGPTGQSVCRKWPTGTYGLPRTNTGCPVAAGVSWRTGYRYHDTEDHNSDNQWTNGLHFDGEFGKNNMKQKFCMKTTPGDGDGNWPRGSYCVFKKGGCPGGFQSGEIYWDDEDDDNQNSRSGEVPDGSYGRNTLIRYCCRNDGSANSPISLPNRSPFYLFRYRQRCQEVSGMNVRDEFFWWDDEDDDNENRVQGAHPYDDGGSRNHRPHYCYYS